jgi:hypothetical protein
LYTDRAFSAARGSGGLSHPLKTPLTSGFPGLRGFYGLARFMYPFVHMQFRDLNRYASRCGFAFALGLILVLAASCTRGRSRIQTRLLPHPNPTVYTFPLPVEETRSEALEAFSIEHQAHKPIFPRSQEGQHFQTTLFPEYSTNAVFGEAIFRDQGNTNDIYLHSMNDPFTASSVYRGRHGGLPFIAAFHLHLTSAGSNSTIVQIAALDPTVMNGEKFGCGPCGPGYGRICDKVQPTTVEEYTILRYLGQFLGVTNMPEVILPP